jgi:hypothetical protein
MTTLAEIQTLLPVISTNLSALANNVAALQAATVIQPPPGSVMVSQSDLDAVGAQVLSIDTQVTTLQASTTVKVS